jgi:hypothetical protein
LENSQDKVVADVDDSEGMIAVAWFDSFRE